MTTRTEVAQELEKRLKALCQVGEVVRVDEFIGTEDFCAYMKDETDEELDATCLITLNMVRDQEAKWEEVVMAKLHRKMAEKRNIKWNVWMESLNMKESDAKDFKEGGA